LPGCVGQHDPGSPDGCLQCVRSVAVVRLRGQHRGRGTIARSDLQAPDVHRTGECQTGSGTTGSREAIWVGYKEVTGGTVASEAIGWQDGTTSGDSIQGTSLRLKSNEPQGYPIQVGEVEA